MGEGTREVGVLTRTALPGGLNFSDGFRSDGFNVRFSFTHNFS